MTTRLGIGFFLFVGLVFAPSRAPMALDMGPRAPAASGCLSSTASVEQSMRVLKNATVKAGLVGLKDFCISSNAIRPVVIKNGVMTLSREFATKPAFAQKAAALTLYWKKESYLARGKMQASAEKIGIARDRWMFQRGKSFNQCEVESEAVSRAVEAEYNSQISTDVRRYKTHFYAHRIDVLERRFGLFDGLAFREFFNTDCRNQINTCTLIESEGITFSPMAVSIMTAHTQRGPSAVHEPTDGICKMVGSDSKSCEMQDLVGLQAINSQNPFAAAFQLAHLGEIESAKHEFIRASDSTGLEANDAAYVWFMNKLKRAQEIQLFLAQ